MLLLRCVEHNSEREELTSVSKEVPEVIEQNDRQQEILSAFRFWVNKNAWCYGDFEYINKKKIVEIYYENEDSEGNNEFYGHLYIPLKGDGKKCYKHFSFYFGKEGAESEPFTDEKVKVVDSDLIYLGKDTFYFPENNISKPKFQSASEKKKRFIDKAKKELTKAINSFEFDKKEDKYGIYKVYIQDFANQDMATNVVIIKDEKIMWPSEILNQMVMDDGTILNDIAYFRGTYSAPRNWSDKNIRKIYERQLELSVCEFAVEVS